jgi:hypothetical protein
MLGQFGCPALQQWQQESMEDIFSGAVVWQNSAQVVEVVSCVLLLLLSGITPLKSSLS